MPRTARRLLAAALVALNAVVTLGGAGLHALPGWGHDSGLKPLARTDHSHGPGKSSHEAREECPVCQFLAQGQLTPDRAAGAASWVAQPADPVAPEVSPASPSLLAAAPRAPPALPPASA